MEKPNTTRRRRKWLVQGNVQNRLCGTIMKSNCCCDSHSTTRRVRCKNMNTSSSPPLLLLLLWDVAGFKTVAAGDWKNWGGQEENQSTVSCYFIQVNYLSLLSYIQWKLSNKTMTYKTSLKNILLNGKRLLLLAVGVWTTQSVNMGRCVPGRLIMYSGLIYKTKKIPTCTPSKIRSPVTCVAGNCSTHCAAAAVNVHTTRQHRRSHSSQ